MKTRICILLTITFIFIISNSCKKDDVLKRPKIKDTEEAKQTEFIKMNLIRYPDNTISKFTSFAFSFAKPLDTDIISTKGEKIKYVKRSSLIQYEKNGITSDIQGNWILNSTKDTLHFIPNEAFKDSSVISVNVEVVLYYSDDSYDASRFTLKEKLKTNEQFCTITPTKTFQLSPLTKSFEFNFIESLNKEIVVNGRKIKFELDELILNDKTYNEKINLNSECTEEKKLKITLLDALKSNSLIQFKLKIKTSFFNNGAWEQFKSQGKPYYYTDTFSYFTQIFNLDSSAIEYSYPEDRQYNFLTKESFKGYVKLKLPSLLTKEQGLSYTARFNLLHGDSVDVALKFNPDSNYFSFEIPQTLQKEKIYRLRFFASNNSAIYNFYNIYFRTSKYEKFEDKWRDVTLGFPSTLGNPDLKECLTSRCEAEENFDYFEYQHIRMRALLEKIRSWYVGYAHDSLYENMKKYGYKLSWRNEEPYGIPPQYAMYIGNNDIKNCRLSDQALISGNTNEIKPSLIYFNSIHIYNNDLYDIRNQIIKKSSSNAWEKQILNLYFLGHTFVSYYCELKYTLPNGETIYTTEVEIKRN